MKTFKAIIQDLKEFSDNHYQLNEFGWGNIANITTKDSLYPMMWVQPIDSTISGSKLTLKMELYIMDLQEQDNSNLIDIMNSTLLIGRDVISEYFEDNDGIEFELDESNIGIIPFEGKFDDLLGGWIFKVELVTILPAKNSCITPKS